MTTLADVYDTLKYRVVVHPYTGVRKYYNHAGQLHREEGPAVIWANGDCDWYYNGQLHRVGGPAVVWGSCAHSWYHNGVLHRTDGPAIEYADGNKEWWIHGVEYTRQEYYLQLKTLGYTV